MGKLAYFVLAPLALIFFIVIGPLLLMWLWNSTADVVFPEAVAQNWLAGSIGWWTAFKVLVICAILFAAAGAAGRRKKD